MKTDPQRILICLLMVFVMISMTVLPAAAEDKDAVSAKEDEYILFSEETSDHKDPVNYADSDSYADSVNNADPINYADNVTYTDPLSYKEPAENEEARADDNITADSACSSDSNPAETAISEQESVTQDPQSAITEPEVTMTEPEQETAESESVITEAESEIIETETEDATASEEDDDEDPALETAAALYTVNGVSIPLSGYEEGVFYGYGECWAFCQMVYKAVWKISSTYGFLSSRATSDDMLRNISSLNDLTVTAEHAKAYISRAALGATIRICDAPFDSSDSAGTNLHSVILVNKSSTGCTIYHDWNGYVTFNTLTWAEFASMFAKFKYFKYIKWPGAEAYDGGGSSPYENTPAVSDVYPDKVSLISASVTTEGVTVSWNTAANADSYYVYRKESGGKWGYAAKQVRGTTYTDTAVVSGKTYVYTVRGYNNASENLSKTYDKTGVTASFLASPASLSVSYTATGVTLKWSTVDQADKYVVYRKARGESYTRIALTASATYKDTKAAEGKVYAYIVRAYMTSAKQLSGCSPYALAFFMKPPEIKTTALTNGIKISWGSVSGATSYRIYRKTAAGKYTVIKDGYTGTDYTDTTAAAGTVYYYAVKAYNKTYNSYSWYNASDCLWMKAPAVTAAALSGKINVSWSKVAGAEGYRVYRKAKGDKRWTFLKELSGGNTLKYVDSSVTSGVIYYYTVKGYNQATGRTIYGGFNTTGASVKAK